MAYLLSLIVNGVTRLQNDTHGTNIYADKHIKNNSNDNYILLGGGGHIDKGTFALANHGVHWDGFSKRATSDAIWGALASSNGYSPLFWLDSINGGGVAFSDKSSQTFMQIDGYFYQNEGRYRITDVTETVTALGTSGNYLTWTKNGTTNNITVPYAAASAKLQTSRTLWGRPFDGTDDVNGHITMNGEYSLKAYMPRKRADGGGWAYSPLIILDASTNDFAHLGIYGGNNTLNYIYIGSNEYYSTQNLLIYPTGNVEAVRFISNISTGTSPLAVTSTTLCTNLNTDMLDGYHASGLFTALSANSTLSITIGGTTLTSSINAATVDGKYISNYYTKSEADDRFVNVAGDTMSGALIFSGVTGGNYNEGIRIQDASNKWAGITFGATGTTGCSPQSGEVAWFAAKEPGGKFLISPNTSSDTVGLRLEKDGNAYWRNNVIFHSGNYTSYVYSKQQSDDRFVNVTGDTMTGTLTITKYGPAIHNYVSSGWAFQRYTAYDDTHNNIYDIGTYYTRDTFEIRRNGGDNWAFSPNTFYGYANNTYYLGTSSYRWANIYSTLGNFSSTVTAGKFHSNASASTDLTIIPPDTAIALETGNGDGTVNAWIWRENYSSSNWGIFHNNSEDDSINFVGANKIRVKISLGSNSLKVGGTEVSLEGHNHDGRYSLVGHNHDGRYLRKDANDSTPYQLYKN